jgi:hypothetical protein
MVNINRSGEIIALKIDIILTLRKPISVFEPPRFKDMGKGRCQAPRNEANEDGDY